MDNISWVSNIVCTEFIQLHVDSTDCGILVFSILFFSNKK